MMYMTSTAANNGSARITVYFRQGTDPDMATVNVQNRIATAEGLLPAEVTKSGITVRKRQTSNIKQLAVYSPDDSFDQSHGCLVLQVWEKSMCTAMTTLCVSGLIQIR